jgi:SNF2 family DNA or RNA helicase
MFGNRAHFHSRSELVAAGTVLQNYAHILELLLRLRQCCDHPFLVTKVKKDQQSKVPQSPRTPRTPDRADASHLARLTSRKLRDFVVFIASQTTPSFELYGPKEDVSYPVQTSEQLEATRSFLHDDSRDNDGCYFGAVECENCVQLLVSRPTRVITMLQRSCC